MLRAVILDFDGVICDSEPLHYQAFQKSFADVGVDITADLYYSKYLGYTDRELVDAVCQDFTLNWTYQKKADFVNKKVDLFARIVRQQDCVMPGVKDFISTVKQNNLRLAICSGSLLCDIELLLAGSDIKDSFEYIVSAEDVEKGKPEPHGYLLALEKLNSTEKIKIKPDECVAVEDSIWGLKAAIAAGMHTAAVATSYSADELDVAEITADMLKDLKIAELKKICR